MIEKAYLFRRKLHVFALALGAVVLFICYVHNCEAHVDLVHVEVDTIVREIMEDIRQEQEQARRELAGNDFGHYEEGNEPGVKHD